MREAAERAAWKELKKKSREKGDRKISPLGVELDLSLGCTVVAGRNGVGKSRLLAAAATALGDKAILIQLHQLCERVRDVHASRDDIPFMEEETGPLSLKTDVIGHVSRVVAREYDNIEWFALDLEPSAAGENNRSFIWADDQSLVPHFRVSYKGLNYSTAEMGLGELSVHVLFWVLEQYRDIKNMTLLLDEPDAYLPPIGSGYLLARVQDVCRTQDWDLLVTTHSEEMIRTATENDGLLVLRRGDGSAVESARSWVDGPQIAAELLSDPPVDLILFCEDETATALTRSLLRAGDPDRSLSTLVNWKDGQGYLNGLSKHLPRHPRMGIKFGLVFDGDQRGKDGKGSASSGWKSIFLPTGQDPDELFKGLAANPERLAARLHTDEVTLGSWLDSLEGADPHDWVNGLCSRHGTRQTVLEALAALWVADHPAECKVFNADVAASLRWVADPPAEPKVVNSTVAASPSDE